MKTPAQHHLARLSRVSDRHTACMGAKLATDRQRLKSIQSLERKIAVKRTLLPDYAAYVADVLENGQGAPDAVL